MVSPIRSPAPENHSIWDDTNNNVQMDKSVVDQQKKAQEIRTTYCQVENETDIEPPKEMGARKLRKFNQLFRRFAANL